MPKDLSISEIDLDEKFFPSKKGSPKSDSYTPSLEEIKNIVINDVILEKQNNSVTEYLKELRNKYQIEILADFNETAN